ncbi:MAG: hypothetical protein Kow0098_24710 [Ignavibacteriaceae bacterium]
MTFARIISTLFVPPSFTILLFTLFAFELETDPVKIFAVILTALTFGFGLLIIMFFYFRKKGKIADQDASVKEERTKPFLYAVVSYLAGLILLILFEANIIIIAFWFCYISNTLLVVLINRYWKISAHSMGASGALGALFFIYNLKALLILPLILLIAWARLYLKLHTPLQVAAGLVLGFTSTYLQIYLIVNTF